MSKRPARLESLIVQKGTAKPANASKPRLLSNSILTSTKDF